MSEFLTNRHATHKRFALAATAAASLLLAACDHTAPATVEQPGAVPVEREKAPAIAAATSVGRPAVTPRAVASPTAAQEIERASAAVPPDQHSLVTATLRTQPVCASVTSSPSLSRCKSLPAGTSTRSTGQRVWHFPQRSARVGRRPRGDKQMDVARTFVGRFVSGGPGVCLSRRGRVPTNSTRQAGAPTVSPVIPSSSTTRSVTGFRVRAGRTPQTCRCRFKSFPERSRPMRYFLGLDAGLVLFAAPVLSDDHIAVRVSYCGDPGSDREADFRIVGTSFHEGDNGGLSRFQGSGRPGSRRRHFRLDLRIRPEKGASIRKHAAMAPTQSEPGFRPAR